jgi:hypothetical protein
MWLAHAAGLAVYNAEDGGYHDIYRGHDMRHTAVGFVADETVQFVVKAQNFFGSSDYSLPSEKVKIPAASVAALDDRPHCPMFMAGLCFRGAACR